VTQGSPWAVAVKLGGISGSAGEAIGRDLLEQEEAGSVARAQSVSKKSAKYFRFHPATRL
jgi:hypothetical protein